MQNPDSPSPCGPTCALPLLASCNRRELRLVRALGQHVHAERAQVICRAGEPADALYVILDGAVGLSTPSEPARRLGRGDGFGELAPLAGTPRRSTAVALVSTELITFGRREVATLLERAPEVTRALLRTVIRRPRVIEKTETSRRGTRAKSA